MVGSFTHRSAAPVDTGTVPGLLAARATAEPDQVALLVEGSGPTTLADQLTYLQWDRRSDAVAGRLYEHGLRRGDRVGLVFAADEWLEFAVGYCGVQKAGGIAVPLGAHLGPRTIAELLAECRVAGSVHGTSGLRPDTPGWRASVAELQRPGADPVLLAVRPGDAAQILYTSGTTGRPKGVVATHANLVYGLDPTVRRRPLAHSRHCLHSFAIGTNAAQTMLINALVTAPTTLILPSFAAERFAALIELYRVGSVFVVPAMAIEMVNQRVHERHDLASVVLLGSTAAALPPAVAGALAAALPGATLTNCYTSTEAAPAQLTMIFSPDRPDAVGRPARPEDILITDPVGHLVTPGDTGVIWLRSEAPPRQYRTEPGLSADLFHDGWVAMGDTGHQDAEGYLHLADRVDDVVKSGGLAVSTLRVEAVLYEHPAVAEAAVIGIPHPVLGTVAAAAVVAAPDEDRASEAQLRAFLADRLGRHELPAVIRYTDALPRNAAGKVRKTELRGLLALGGPSNGPRPGTDTQTTLAGLWSEVLDGGRVGTADDFFALGGDSLRAARLATLAGEAFHIRVPAALAFDRPDLAGQAAWIDAARDGQAVSEPDEGSAPVCEQDPAALSSLQDHLLRWMHETVPARDVGPMHVCVRITEDVDASVLAISLDQLVHRHDALRTWFAPGPHGWRARTAGERAPELMTGTATGDTPSACERHAAALLRAELVRPFDWRHGPLVRAILIRVGPTEHLMALAVHHLVVDGWSIGVLLRDLGWLYSAQRTGAIAALPPTVQCGVVVAASRAQWPANLRWWRDSLSGAPPSVEPFPGRRPTADYAADFQPVSLDVGLVQRLRAIARQHSASPFLVVAAGWIAVLARHTGAAEFTVLTPVTGRHRPEFDNAVGCLAQSLLIRLPVGDDPTVGQLVARIRDGFRDAVDRQAYPFAEFGAAVPYPVEIPFSRWPARPHFPGLLSEPYDVPHGLVWNWPLAGEDRGVPKLELGELPDGRLDARLTYNRSAFSAGTIARLAADLHTVLAQAPDQPLHRVSHLTAAHSNPPQPGSSR